MLDLLSTTVGDIFNETSDKCHIHMKLFLYSSSSSSLFYLLFFYNVFGDTGIKVMQNT